MTPIRSVTSVQARKDSAFSTVVTVYASGNNIDFRLSHAEAQFKDAVMRIVLEAEKPPAAAPVAPPPPDEAEQIRRLAGLRDDGLISHEEFDAKKRQILGL